ncbi:modification methylase [Candidatus Chloroploca asiatica]|uniref:Methyltransferase n=1 Tax=Candidatus Chloroploca asiatica TaxID=1506545 RepID=A0A2H3LB55_9CHLR|nr:modification methylase [Candidatus Chloroploca asiatica]
MQEQFRRLYDETGPDVEYLRPNAVYQGDARALLPRIRPNSVALSIWSPPYFVGKQYEAHLTFEDWQDLLQSVIQLHFSIIKPGGFLVINIADILCFKDPAMPKIQADAVHRKRSSVTREAILQAWEEHPNFNRYQIAKLLGCSEQTIDRRLNGNNIRGGKHETQTRVKIVGGLVEAWALESGFFPYDRRIWVKDAAWENSRWASLSYRSVDEFEYIYIFWKPGITSYDRQRLTADEWKNWGSRGVWSFPSVRANYDHEAKFPVELPTRVIRLLTDADDLVLDCFLGSGTTAVACVREGRQYLGIEFDETYVQLAHDHISAELNREQLLMPVSPQEEQYVQLHHQQLIVEHERDAD